MNEVLNTIVQELCSDIPSLTHFVRMSLRLIFALVLSGIVGLERQQMGKPAGVRTHMLVALGSAVSVLIPELAGMPPEALTRVMQGTITGIGFIGGGAILKLTDQEEIKGVTTASSIWLTAMLGLAAGTGRIGLALLSALLAFVILGVLGRIEAGMHAEEKKLD